MATYSFLDVGASITGPGGAFSLGAGAGVADEGITVEREEDKTNLLVGADGAVQHSLHAANHGTVSVRLLKTSPTNALLSLMYNAQKASSATWGLNVISITNPVSGDTIVCRYCAFTRHAQIVYAKDGPMQEWQFKAGIIDGVLGVYPQT